MVSPASLSNVERQQLLLQRLADQQRITVAEICEQFSVSEATARRDLEQLAEKDLLQRVHGGAIAIRRAAPELPILERSQEQSAEKGRIGVAAAALIADGETVFLGSGTTVLEVAKILRQRRNLTIITNSLPVVNALAGLPEISVVVMGGVLRDSELSFIGHITEQALAEVRADKVFMGTRALDLEHGLTNDYLPETLTDRAILRCGREIIIVADHTKLGCVSAAFLAPLSSIRAVVTGQEADVEFIRFLQEKGIQVITA
jgi:DeoR family transcriptional regulator of aga operon